MTSSDDYVQFKYRKIDKHLLKSLVNGEIYFARPDRLNDPFDCKVDVGKGLENAISKAEISVRERLERFRDLNNFFTDIQTRILTLGVCSFSGNPVNTLMWSHYADEHRGVCLAYNLPESYFYENKDHILGIGKMVYGASPLSDWFLEEGSQKESFEEFRDDLLIQMLTVKAEPWKYEEEVRIIRNAEGIEKLEMKHLKQICFGLHTSESDIALIRNIVEQYEYDITLCKMKRSSGSDFGVEMVEI